MKRWWMNVCPCNLCDSHQRGCEQSIRDLQRAETSQAMPSLRFEIDPRNGPPSTLSAWRKMRQFQYVRYGTHSASVKVLIKAVCESIHVALIRFHTLFHFHHTRLQHAPHYLPYRSAGRSH